MNTVELDEAKLLWKMFYARECFVQARGAATHILKEKLERDDPLFAPLVTAVYVLYAKPFTRADAVGKLGDDIIPAKHKELHDMLIEHRHQIYAHRDGDGFPVDDLGPVNQVTVARTHQEMRLFATDFHARFPAMPPVIELCKTLEEKTDYHVEKMWNKHSGSVPNKVGEYMLNVHDLNASIWLPRKPMVLR